MAVDWYIAKSKSRKEHLVIDGLARWGVETFFPYIRRPGRQGTLEPLFSTYIFCRFDADDPRWQAIRWLPGLSYFLSEEDRPSPVPDALVEYLREKTRQWNGGAFERRFERGERVVIVNGPFSGLDAVFQAYVPSRQRCQVLLRTLGGVTPVELPEKSVNESEASWSVRLSYGQG